MRLPSLQYLAGEARASFSRFPLVLVSALVAAACGLIASDVDKEAPFVRVMVTAQLGFPLFFALAVAAESNGWSRSVRIALSAIAVAALAAYHFTLPDHMDPGAVTRFLQLNVGLHLLAAVLPFVRGGRHNGFWQYNRALFLRFLTAVLYSAVIYLGLVVALLALDKLLGVTIPDKSYLRLLIVTGFVFNTWVFLGGVPRDIAGLESVTEYPRALKVFAQYILIPLVVVYLTILTIYLVKVIVTTEWPSGWIGWMVSSVAVVGILALLLVWPVANQIENRWVATYTRWYFIFMLPAIVMLMLAVQRRIDQYGITENRYFLAVLSVWLAAIAVYFILSRGRRIKVIPVTLCVVAFVTWFGPWGAYAVSRRSQTARLERILDANGILVDGAIVKAANVLSLDDRREISAITLYLVKYHGTKTFDRWLDVASITSHDSTRTSRYEYDDAQAIVRAMGVVYLEPWESSPGGDVHFSYMIGPGEAFEIDGADYMVKLTSKTDTGKVGTTGLVVAWEDSLGVTLRDASGLIAVSRVDSVFARLGDPVMSNKNAIPANDMRVSMKSERARLIVYFTMLSGVTRNSARTIDHVNADCFVDIR